MTGILEARIATLLERVVRCFRRERIPYVLIGAWALAAWGRPRATNDLDFLVLVGEGDVDRLSHRLTQAGLELDETWQEWNPMLKGSQLRFQSQGVTIDVLLPRDLHDQQVFLRKRKKRMDGRYYWVLSPEDFVLQKVKVQRPRDFEDAVSVAERLQSTLDREYLDQWARQLGIMEELRYVMGS